MSTLGKYILVIGFLLVIVGLVLWIFGDKLGWLGNLPGDIKIKGKNMTFYFPVVTMIIVSAVLTFLLWLIRKISG